MPVPAQGFEKRVNELSADLGLIIFAGLVSLALRIKPLNQLQYFLWKGPIFTCKVIAGKNEAGSMLRLVY